MGGVFRHVRDLCEAQIAEGHDLGIVCDSNTGGPHEDRLIAEIAPKLALGLIRTPMQRHIGPGDITASRRTLKALKRMRPDILHGHGAKGGFYSRTFGTLMRAGGQSVARLYSPHGGSLHYDPKSAAGRVYFGIERMLERLTDHLVFVSDYERRTYEDKVGVPRCPSTVVYNGLREEEFEPVEPADGASDFLFVGTMRDLKGPDLFLLALKSVEDKTGRALTATLVGDGADLPRYRQLAESLEFGERVQFLPAMSAREAFRLGRLMVVPSRAESMPYIVLEALAAGKSLIATKVGGIPEIFGPSSPALCMPSADSLVAAMEQALADESAWRKLMPGREALVARFSLGAMARNISRIYQECLSP